MTKFQSIVCLISWESLTITLVRVCRDKELDFFFLPSGKNHAFTFTAFDRRPSSRATYKINQQNSSSIHMHGSMQLSSRPPNIPSCSVVKRFLVFNLEICIWFQTVNYTAKTTEYKIYIKVALTHQTLLNSLLSSSCVFRLCLCSFPAIWWWHFFFFFFLVKSLFYCSCILYVNVCALCIGQSRCSPG